MVARFEQEFRCVRVGEKILRVNFKPARSRQGGHDLRDVWEPKTHACPHSTAVIR